MQAASAADTAWMMVATALVMLMVPGLALFYGGMVGAKNVLSTFMHCFFALALVTVHWALLGYSLAFGPSHLGLIGSLDFCGLVHVQGLHGQIPHLLYAIYQGTFAAIAVAIVAGAYCERMRFDAFVCFSLAWLTLVYVPVAHWTWTPAGWLAQLGAMDFAGGTVVHLSAGTSALVVALMLGPRLGFPAQAPQPHNLPFTLLGAGLLWFGWFGFNGGSALAADAVAALALVNSHLAAAAAALAWAGIEAVRHGRVTALGTASGLVAGLVGITPAAGYVTPLSALLIGALSAGIGFLGVLLKHRCRYDDSLDAFGIHGIGGAWGALATGLWASRAANPAGADGALLGHLDLLWRQGSSVLGVAAYAAAMTWLILWGLRRTLGLRVSSEAEREGLDAALHAERAYAR